MSQYITCVRVLHCGGEEEVFFLEYLEKELSTYIGRSYVLEYTKFQNYQAKDIIMYNDAVRYKKEKLPMIVLISKAFFELIWITSYKQSIINTLTNYSTKNCLHIWMDVSEDYVKYRSIALCRTDGYFRRIKAPELTTKLATTERIIKIHDLLNVNGDGKFDTLNNYAVDNEVEDMRQRFQIATFGAVTEVRIPKPVVKLKPKKHDPYKDALRLASMTPAEMEAEGLLAQGRTQQNRQSNSKPPKNRKNNTKKKAETDAAKLLTEISEKDKKQIAVYLDRGAGANWRQLAETFGVSLAEIRKMIDSPAHMSQTAKLLEYLNNDRPELELNEFMQKCKQIQRGDVSTYINDNILSKRDDW